MILKKKSGRVLVSTKTSGSGRVSGTRWALRVTAFKVLGVGHWGIGYFIMGHWRRWGWYWIEVSHLGFQTLNIRHSFFANSVSRILALSSHSVRPSVRHQAWHAEFAQFTIVLFTIDISYRYIKQIESYNYFFWLHMILGTQRVLWFTRNIRWGILTKEDTMTSPWLSWTRPSTLLLNQSNIPTWCPSAYRQKTGSSEMKTSMVGALFF